MFSSLCRREAGQGMATCWRERGAALTRRKEAETAGRVSRFVHFRDSLDCIVLLAYLRGGAELLINTSIGTAPAGLAGAAAGELDLDVNDYLAYMFQEYCAQGVIPAWRQSSADMLGTKSG